MKKTETVPGSNGHPTGHLKDHPPGDMWIVKKDDFEILLIHLDSGVYALAAKCIHGGCSLLHGILEGNGLRCRCHYSLFDITTGAVLDGPATTPQPVFPVKNENGEIFILI